MTGQTFGVILVGLSIIGNLKLSQAQDSRCLSKPDTTCDKQTQTAWFYNSDTKTCYSMTACNVDASNSFNSSMYCQHACGPKVDDSTTVHTYDTNIAKPSDEIKENKTESPDAVTDATVFATTEVPAAAVQYKSITRSSETNNFVITKKISKMSSTTPPPLHSIVATLNHKASAGQ